MNAGTAVVIDVNKELLWAVFLSYYSTTSLTPNGFAFSAERNKTEFFWE
jgi:hypothetical protein